MHLELLAGAIEILLPEIWRPLCVPPEPGWGLVSGRSGGSCANCTTLRRGAGQRDDAGRAGQTAIFRLENGERPRGEGEYYDYHADDPTMPTKGAARRHLKAGFDLTMLGIVLPSVRI